MEVPRPSLPLGIPLSSIPHVPMRRSETKAFRYLADRYMEHLSPVELERRAADLRVNHTELSPEGRVQINRAFVRPWRDLVEEFTLRAAACPSGFAGQSVSEVADSGTIARAAVCAVRARGALRGDPLIKYGAAEHLRVAYSEGVVRIAPASEHAASNNHARRDDELRVNLRPHPSHVRMEVLNKGQTRPGPASR